LWWYSGSIGANEISLNEVMQIVSNNRDQGIKDDKEVRKQGDWENDGEI
jgi:hypothetical protein